MSTVEIIAAVANNNVIGSNGQLPWGRLPRDLMHFKNLTMGHSLVIGTKTLLSLCAMIGRRINLLPGRRIYVLTHDLQKITRFPDCVGVTDIDSIIRLGDRSRVFIAGGSSIYQQFVNIESVRVMHITRIYANYHGDTYFPVLSSGEWNTIKYEFHSADNENKHALSFITKIRSQSSQFDML